MGSLSMLRDWRKMTKRSEENEKLKRALIAIKHQRLADDIPNDDMASKYELEERKFNKFNFGHIFDLISFHTC